MEKVRSLKVFMVTAVFGVSLLFFGCAQIQVVPKSTVDTPRYHYQVGMKYLDKGNVDQALAEFARSRELDPKYGPAYDGLALVALRKGKYEAGLKSVRLAIRYGRRDFRSYITRGRLYMAQDKLGKARASFRKAVGLAPQLAEPQYYVGQSYMKSFEFDKAEQAFKKALEIDPNFVKADKAWARADRIKRAQPGSKTVKELALVEKIKRAEVAVLLITELNLDRRLAGKPRPTEETSFIPPAYVRAELKKKAQSLTITDIKGYWAEGSIRMALALNLMSLFPDNSFRPDAPITRANLAMIVQKVLIAATGNTKISTKFFDSASPFPDVPNTSYAFNAIMVATTRGIMEADIDGTFGPDEPVSGAEAILALGKLREVLREEAR